MAVVDHGRRDFIGEPRADRMHRDGLCPRHLAHHVDIVHAPQSTIGEVERIRFLCTCQNEPDDC